jgi:hypothetical protein
MNIHLSEQLRYLESHQKEFEKYVKEAYSTDSQNVTYNNFIADNNKFIGYLSFIVLSLLGS